MTLKAGNNTIDTMGGLEQEPGIYKFPVPQASARDIDTALQAQRKSDEVEFRYGYNKTGVIYQIGRRGHWLNIWVVNPEEYNL